MSSETASERITLRRDPGRFGEGLSAFRANAGRAWKKRWVKVVAVLLALPVIAYFILWLIFARGLPSAESLLNYEPVLPTYVRDINGQPVQTFARERRVQLAYEEYPPQLINAFLAAEDRTFFQHGGLDYPGLVGAVVDYVAKSGSGERARGGSTITQQVAKIFFTGDEYSRSEEHTSELQSQSNLVCRLLLEKKKNTPRRYRNPPQLTRIWPPTDRVPPRKHRVRLPTPQLAISPPARY